VTPKRFSILWQRIKYLASGNFHGVSGNWLSKNSTGIYSSIDIFVDFDPANFDLDSKDLVRGKEVFKKVSKLKSGLNFGSNFDCEEGLACFLYAYILKSRPLIVIETGVANGITTNVIMKALENTGGSLHSFDVESKSHNVYQGLGSWTFHLLSGNLRGEFRKAVAQIGRVDLWIHDSNHGYSWQSYEYGLAQESLSTTGLLVSDDIDASTAWGLSKELFAESYAIFDKRKFFGVAKLAKKEGQLR